MNSCSSFFLRVIDERGGRVTVTGTTMAVAGLSLPTDGVHGIGVFFMAFKGLEQTA